MSSEWAEQAATGDNHGMPGKVLAAQREAMGWTVEQVADQLKLAVRQVVALEAGDYASLPGPAVVRGFVRAYAKIVKLDAAPLVAQIPLDTPGPSDATGTTIRHRTQASFSEVRFPTHGKRASLPIVPIVAIVVLVGAAAAAWHFGLVAKLMSRGETAATPASATAVLQPNNAALAVPVASAPVVPTTSLLNPSVPLISVPPPSTAAAGLPSAGVAPAVTSDKAPGAAATPIPSANALVITVREDSWIEVKRAKGTPLISRLVKAGSTESFDVTEPVTLVVGKPTGVSATLRGTVVDLPAQAGAVARVNLK